MNEQESRVELILEMADVGVWDFSAQSETLQWCRRAKGLFGLSENAEVTYKRFLEGLHAEDRERVHNTLQQALKSPGSSYNMEFRTIGLEDGVERIIGASGKVRASHTEGPPRLLGVSTDLTELRQRERELHEAKAAAEAGNQAKSEFLANMSHEMRTPLGAILGFADLALEAPAQSTPGFIRRIRSNCDQLLTLVNGLLDLSKVEEKGIQIEESKFSLSGALDEVISSLSFQAKEKKIHLAFASTGKVPEHIDTDPVRFKQVLSNLVNNAIKFTERGKVEVHVRAVPPVELGKKIKLEVTVTDTGIGIPPEQRENVFQRFYQADSSHSRKYGGAGLGLSLSRNLARALGGDVLLAKSTPGNGSTFVFTFENGIYQSDTRFVTLGKEIGHKPEKPSTPPGTSLEGVRVLLVEDAPDNQVLVSLFLKSAGAQVDLAENGWQAIERASQADYDVVLMDIQMPELDGYSATSKLRDRGYDKPIIALTAHALSSERDKCLHAGFDEHLSKPINRKLLLNEVAQFASRNKAHLH